MGSKYNMLKLLVAKWAEDLDAIIHTNMDKQELFEIKKEMENSSK